MLGVLSSAAAKSDVCSEAYCDVQVPSCMWLSSGHCTPGSAEARTKVVLVVGQAADVEPSVQAFVSRQPMDSSFSRARQTKGPDSRSEARTGPPANTHKLRVAESQVRCHVPIMLQRLHLKLQLEQERTSVIH